MATEYFFDTITLTNHKDKTLTIFELYVIYEKDILIPLIDFDPPLLIKAYEAVNCDVPEISGLSCYGMDLKLSTFSPEAFEFYISTPNGIKKCKASSRPNSISEMVKHEYRMATVSRNKYRGNTYSSKIAYAINFTYNGKKTFAFITIGGRFYENWPFSETHIPEYWLSSPEELSTQLKTTNIGAHLGDFTITDLRDQTMSAVLRRALNPQD